MSGAALIGFDDLHVGQVIALGAVAVDHKGLRDFIDSFSPGWDGAKGAPDAMLYALWAKLAHEAAKGWAEHKVLGVDALRWMRNPPGGELLRGRMTVMGLDPVGESKGVVIAQHDLLDESGRLVFACLTRSVLSRG